MRIIATDEAGYGPKLGPLVIGATDWQVTGDFDRNAICGDSESIDANTPSELVTRFLPLKETFRVDGAVITVDDSKAVFKPKSATSSSNTSSSKANARSRAQPPGPTIDPLRNLHATVSVANRWCNQPATTFGEWLPIVAPDDIDTIAAAPWFSEISNAAFGASQASIQRFDDIIQAWSVNGIALSRFCSRVVTAAAFNAACDRGMNKADLLSESTLGIVRRILDGDEPGNDAATNDRGDEPTLVFCDRHGGRRYYAGVLQHVFGDCKVTVVSESKRQSVYRMQYRDQNALVHFTVKGDSFTPVAMSSIYAKYIRERMMQSLNAFFASHHRDASPLKPTAGYPVDADRFLQDAAPIIRRQKIAVSDLVRQR